MGLQIQHPRLGRGLRALRRERRGALLTTGQDDPNQDRAGRDRSG